MGRSGTTLRWLACAALAVVATTLVVSFTRDDQSPSTGSVPVAESSPAGTIASHTPVSSSSTPDAQAGPPSRPDAARGLSIASAEAFVQYYLDEAVNHLKLTGQGGAVRDASSPSCTPCRGDITYFAATNSRNGRLTGDFRWKNVEVRSARPSGTSMVLTVDASAGRHAAVEKPGTKPKAFTGGRQYLKVTLAASGKDWVVFDVAYR
jgi:hypothetical protein